jgi:hypothetical protein
MLLGLIVLKMKTRQKVEDRKTQTEMVGRSGE